MRRGLFFRDGTYDTLARISPNDVVPRLPGFRPPVGFALKVLDVPTEDDSAVVDQDFIYGGTDRFFAKDAEAAVDLVIAHADGGSGLGRYVFPGLDPRRWRLREAGILLQTVTQLDANPLVCDYNTQVVISCGELAVKGALVPRHPDARPWWRRLGRDPRRAMAEQLAAGPVAFDVMQQRQGPGDPVNDPRQRWTGAWVKVAELHFASQEPGSGEGLVFTLGHCLPEHKALGEIPELRIAMYGVISALRQKLNAFRR
jgi:hypothetical protein